MTHNQVVQVVSHWFKLNPKVKVVSRYSYDFPVPDIQIQTKDNQIIQVECKPTTDNKREYITGLGQAIAYCVQSDFVYLAIPLKEMKKYEKWFWPESVGLLGVEQSNVVELRKPKKNKIISDEKRREIKRGYAYYRDLTLYEIYSIMKDISSFKISNHQDKIDNIIWNAIIKHRNWKSAKSSNLLNIKLLIRDLKLFSFQQNEILQNGRELIEIGDKNDEELFKEYGRKLFLIDGNFIDIIAIIQEMNEEYQHWSDINSFKKELSGRIVSEKLASESTNVMRDLQDIPRIMIQLDVLHHHTKSSLFNQPYSINWKKLIPLIKNR